MGPHSRAHARYPELEHSELVSPNDPEDADERRAVQPHRLSESDVFLTIDDLCARYRLGRTRVYRLVHEPWFPEPITRGAYRWSLRSVRDAEAQRSAPSPPQRPQPKRPGPRAA